jgi:hypothetical protein
MTSLGVPDTFLAVTANLVVNAALFAVVLMLGRRRVTSTVAVALSMLLTLFMLLQMVAVNILSVGLMGISAWAAGTRGEVVPGSRTDG